jgi:ABC-type multidrug transport system ATPase subunit
MIEVNQLYKQFDRVKALNGLTFQVNEGELFGVIGPDGAGKSTLFRILISLLLPDSGSVRLWGLNPVTDYKQIRRMIGYMPGKFSLYEDLSISENLNFFATVFGTTVQENYHIIEDIYKQIEPFKDRPAGKLSGGMKQKLALSCALIHKPKLLVLDEPTTGVDAVSRREFWEMLQNLKQQGITILVSTPYMDEAELCDRVALMQNGSLLETNTPAGVVQGFKGQLYGVKNHNMYELLKLCREFPGIGGVYPFGEMLHVTFSDIKLTPNHLREYLKSRGATDVIITPIEPTIEDCFMEMEKRT